MAWVFPAKRFRNLLLIDDIMDQYKYVEILNHNLISSAQKHGHDKFIFQQYNDQKYISLYA